MRQQMMLQMSTMYSNMTMAWSQNNYGAPGNNIAPWLNLPQPQTQNQNAPALGFMTPHINPWFPMDPSANPLASQPNGSVCFLFILSSFCSNPTSRLFSEHCGIRPFLTKRPFTACPLQLIRTSFPPDPTSKRARQPRRRNIFLLRIIHLKGHP